MNHIPASVEVTADPGRGLARAWLLMAVAALLASGLFVLLIIASRMPVVGEWFPLKNFFHLAIVVHVDFSVLVWFGALSASLWTLNSRPGLFGIGRAALGLVIVGALLLAAAPFQPGRAIMSNYVPVLDNALFGAGLGCFALGAVLAALRQMALPRPVSAAGPEIGVARFGLHSAAVIVVLSAAGLVWSYLALPDYLTAAAWYETLFWGGGHILQFAWVQIMLVAWLWLAAAAGVPLVFGPRWLLLLLAGNFAAASLGVWGYLNFAVGSPGQRDFFIWLMAAGGGLAAGPIGIAVLHGAVRGARRPGAHAVALRDGLVWSVLLFGVGGGLGFFISAGNTIVPAHYHGCIVSITLAFMLLALELAPAFGFGRARPRLVRAIAWTYGPGQLLHIGGLAWSGGHGVARKTPGAAQGLDSLAEIAGMAVMGLGGLIAIAGGVMFLIAFGGCLIRRPHGPAPTSRGAAGAGLAGTP